MRPYAPPRPSSLSALSQGGIPDARLSFEEYLVARGWYEDGPHARALAGGAPREWPRADRALRVSQRTRFDVSFNEYQNNEWDERENDYIASLEDYIKRATPEAPRARARARACLSPEPDSSPRDRRMTRALRAPSLRRKVLGYTTDENGIIIDDSIAVAASGAVSSRRAEPVRSACSTPARGSAPPPNYDSELNPMFEVRSALRDGGYDAHGGHIPPPTGTVGRTSNPGDPLARAAFATAGSEPGEAGRARGGICRAQWQCAARCAPRAVDPSGPHALALHSLSTSPWRWLVVGEGATASGAHRRPGKRRRSRCVIENRIRRCR